MPEGQPPLDTEDRRIQHDVQRFRDDPSPENLAVLEQAVNARWPVPPVESVPLAQFMEQARQRAIKRERAWRWICVGLVLLCLLWQLA